MDIPKRPGQKTAGPISCFLSSISAGPLKIIPILLLGISCTAFLGGCALNQIAHKEDIAAAKTDISEDILKLRSENRALNEQLATTAHQIEELRDQIQTIRTENAGGAKFVQEKLQQLNSAIDGAKKDQEKISTDFAGKIQVVLDEVSKENARLHERIDKLGLAGSGQASKRRSRVSRGASRTALNVGDTNGAATYTVAPGDTLAKIAKRCGVSIWALLQNNTIENPDHLQVGQRLSLPAEKSEFQGHNT